MKVSVLCVVCENWQWQETYMCSYSHKDSGQRPQVPCSGHVSRTCQGGREGGGVGYELFVGWLGIGQCVRQCSIVKS